MRFIIKGKQSLCLSAGGLAGAVSPPRKFDISNKIKVNLRHLVRIITDILTLISCIFLVFSLSELKSIATQNVAKETFYKEFNNIIMI